MAILRKNNKSKFTVVGNDIIRDENLSLKALGLLVHLLSLPDDWEFSEDGLIKIFKKDGQASVRSGLKELESTGYLKRERKRDELGHMSSVEWTVYENPHLENPSLVIPNLGNQPQYNTKEIKDEINKELTNTPYNPPEGESVSKPKKQMLSKEYCQEVLDKFALICKDLPKPQKLTDSRKRAIGKALPDITSFGGWDKFFGEIESNDFLSGRKGDWRADFDWVMKPNNLIRIIEGRYSNKSQATIKQSKPVGFNQGLKQFANAFSIGEQDDSSSFEEFWKVYPNKYGYGDAERVWNDIQPDVALAKRIIEIAGRITKVEKYSGDGAAFIPSPEKWLSGKHWEDEILQPPKTYSYEFTGINSNSVEENAKRTRVKVKVTEND